MRVNLALAVASLCLIFLSCNASTDIMGTNGAGEHTPQLADKKLNSQDQAADNDFEEDLESLPPELIGGTYLTSMICDELTPSNISLPKHLATYGCGFFRKDNNTAIKVGNIKQDWTLKSRGQDIPHKILNISSASKVSAAFLVRKSDLLNGISASVKLEGKDGKTGSFENAAPKYDSGINGSNITIFNQPGSTININ